MTLLARTAAHEIHNPLAVILGYLQLLRPRLAEDDKAAEWVRQMHEAGGRVRDAVDRLGRITRVESTPRVGRAPVMLDMARSTTARDDARGPAGDDAAAEVPANQRLTAPGRLARLGRLAPPEPRSGASPRGVASEA